MVPLELSILVATKLKISRQMPFLPHCQKAIYRLQNGQNCRLPGGGGGGGSSTGYALALGAPAFSCCERWRI